MIFHGRTMAMAAMNMVSTGRFSEVSFHLRRCPQEVASLLFKKTSIFGSRRSKLDHLTVHIFAHFISFIYLKVALRGSVKENELPFGS
jgi:hypothetical protein